MHCRTPGCAHTASEDQRRSNPLRARPGCCRGRICGHLPLPRQLSRSACACSSTSTGRQAGPAEKLNTRLCGWPVVALGLSGAATACTATCGDSSSRQGELRMARWREHWHACGWAVPAAAVQLGAASSRTRPRISGFTAAQSCGQRPPHAGFGSFWPSAWLRTACSPFPSLSE